MAPQQKEPGTFRRPATSGMTLNYAGQPATWTLNAEGSTTVRAGAAAWTAAAISNGKIAGDAAGRCQDSNCYYSWEAARQVGSKAFRMQAALWTTLAVGGSSSRLVSSSRRRLHDAFVTSHTTRGLGVKRPGRRRAAVRGVLAGLPIGGGGGGAGKRLRKQRPSQWLPR